MPLSLEALAVLDAIDRRGSFAAAAQELSRVPSAITYAVRRLEEDLDVLLFDRRGHRARLTAAGRELLAAGRLLLRAAGELEQRVQRIGTGWEPSLVVAVDAAVPLALVFPLVAQFYAACRDRQAAHTRLSLVTEVLGGSWDALSDGRADLAVGASGEPPAGGGYRTQPLADIRNVFAVAPFHPLAAEPEPLSAATIARHRAVVATDSSRRLPPRSSGLAGEHDVLAVPDLAVKLEAQVAGLGCGFLPAMLAAPALAAGRLVAKAVDEPKPPQRLSLAWRVQRPGRALAWWIDAVARSGIGERLAATVPPDGAPAPPVAGHRRGPRR